MLKEKDKISKQIEEYNLKHPIINLQTNEDKNKMDIEEEKEEEKNEEKKEAKEEEKKTTNAKTDIKKLLELKPYIYLPDSLKNIKKNEDEKKMDIDDKHEDNIVKEKDSEEKKEDKKKEEENKEVEKKEEKKEKEENNEEENKE